MESVRGVTNFAGVASNPFQPLESATVSVAVLGTDAVLAAAPALPVQLAHACLRAGFTTVIPASWGDELIAAAVLRRLPQYGSSPVVQCSCPIVAHRLLAASGDLRPVLLPLVPPPVAVARYLRALARPARVRVTYIGTCPGATDDSIDIRMSPDALLAMLGERGIVLADQPQAFESVIPPDRRRYRSQPGGVPDANTLWTEHGSRTLVELHDDDFVTELAQQLLSGKSVLIDASTRLGCVCSGAIGASTDPRARIVAMEPPRSPAPVVEERTPIDLDLPIPAASRTPLDVCAVPPASARASHAVQPPIDLPVIRPPEVPPQIAKPVEMAAAVDSEIPAIEPAQAPHPKAPEPQPAKSARATTPPALRTIVAAFPVARDNEGRTLPRAYVARSRSTPRGVPVVAESQPAAKPAAVAVSRPAEETPAASIVVEPAVIAVEAARPEVSLPQASAPEVAQSEASLHQTASARQSRDPIPREPIPRESISRESGTSFTRGQLALILIAVAAIAICASTVVGVIVSRSVVTTPSIR